MDSPNPMVIHISLVKIVNKTKVMNLGTRQVGRREALIGLGKEGLWIKSNQNALYTCRRLSKS